MRKVDLFLENFKAAGGEVASSLDEVLDEFNGCSFCVEPRLKKRLAGRDIREAPPEEAEVSITRAVAAAADTGSLIFAFDEEDTHKLTALPKIHVALLQRRRIYRTIEDALRKVEGSYISVVTGPSKTGDIELIHVAGVHGPERLIVVLEGK